MALGTVRRAALAYVGFGKQSVEGTAVAPTKFSRWQQMGPAAEQMRMGVYRDGFSHDYSVALKEAQWHDGQYTGWLYPDSSAALLQYFLGGTDVVSGGADPYTHTFSAATGCYSLPFITFEHSMGCDQEVDRIADCYVDALQIQATAGGLVTMQTNWKGRTVAAQSDLATVTYETNRPATFMDGTMTFTGLTVASVDVTELNIRMRNNSDQVFTLGSVYPRIMPAGREFEVEFSVFVPNNSLYREVFFGASGNTTGSPAATFLTSLEAHFVTTPSGGNAREVKITLNNIEMEAAVPVYHNDAKAFIVSCTGKAVTPSSGEICTVVAKNAVSTAYSA